MSACFSGWTLDALDVQVYAFAIPSLIAAFGLTSTQAGLIGSATLLISAFGGWFCGVLADRYGRVRMLQIAILWYAFFTFLTGFANSYPQLIICRAFQGLGFGGEWAAGAVLIGEVIRDKYRGRAVGFVQSGWAVGWGAAALLYTVLFMLLPEAIAWRVLFWIGILPALLVFWIRGHVQEPETFRASRARSSQDGGRGMLRQVFRIFRPEYRVTTIKVALMSVGAQAGSNAWQVWLPTYLKTERHLSIVGTGSFTLVFVGGAFFGFLFGAWLADAIGRRGTFIFGAMASAVLIVAYMMLPFSNTTILVLGAPVGFCAYTLMAPMGAYMTELYPTEVRGTGQGFCYNAGRGVAAVFPVLIGALSTRLGLGEAIAIFGCASYLLVVIAVLTLPETRGRALAASHADYKHIPDEAPQMLARNSEETLVR
jgi:MFS family permease